MRRPRSGRCAVALEDPTVHVQSLLGANAVTTGRTFWVRGIIAYNSHAANDGVLTLYDGTGNAVAVATEQLTAPIPLPHGATTVVEFSAPGLAVRENLVAGLDGAVGTVAAYDSSCWGYEEDETV